MKVIGGTSNIKLVLELTTIQENFSLYYKGHAVKINWDKLVELGLVCVVGEDYEYRNDTI